MTKGKDGDHSVDLLESDSDTDSSNGSNNEKHDDIVDDDETIVPTLSSAFALRNHHTSGADNQSAAAAAASALPTKKRHRPYHHSNSPATQTLDALALSQQSADLNYDLSQLEYDLVAALVQTKKTRVLPCDEDENDENNTTDEPAKQRTSNDTCTFSSSANKKGPARLVQRRLEEAAVKTKAAMSHDNKKKKQSKAAAFASSRSTLPRLILPAHVTAAACQSQKTAQPTTYSSSIFGKRGRLPESDRRDIRQISVKTGKTVQTFASFSEAGKAVGFSRHIVASILRGTYKANHYKGWTFRFVEDDNTDETAETSDRGVNRKGHLFEHANEKDDHKENAIYDSDSDSEGTLQARDVDWPRKGLDSAGFALTSARRRKTYNRIEQIDVLTGETLDTFPSFVVAAEQTGINRQKIAAMVKGELDSFEGSTFKYDDDEKEDLDSKDAVLSTMQAMRSTRPVPGNQSSDKSRRFRSGRAAFRNETMVPSRNNANSGVISLKRVVRSSKVAIPVEEIDFATGILIQTYRSLTLASEQSGANRHIISNILKGKVESWRGKAWRYSSPDLVQRVDSKTGQEQSALGLHTTMGEDHIDDFEDTDDSEKRDREETNCEHFSSRFCSAIESPEVLGAGQTLKTSRRVSEDSTSIDEDLDVASETEGKRLRETTIREQSASPSCTKKNTSEILGAAQTQKKSRRTVEGSKSPYQGWDDASGASDCSVASMQRIRAVASRDSNYSEPKTASPKVIDSCIEENQLQNSIVALCQRTTPSKQAAPPNGAIPIEADQNTCDCSVGSMQRIRTVVSRESNTDDLKPSPLDLIDFVTDDYKLQGATAVVNCNPTTSSKPLRPSNGVTPIEEEENPTVIGQLYQPTESCVKTIRNVHSPNPDQRVEHREFEIRNITLATNGSLGVVVTKTRAPDDLLVLLQEKYGLAPSNMGSLQLCVGELKAGGIAHTAGIDNGDFLLYPKRFACESSHVLHAEYNLVVGAIKNERRPAIFLLAREILKSTSEFTNATSGIKALGLTEPIDQHVHPGNSSTSLDSSKKSDDQNDQAAQIEGSTEMMIPIVSIDVQKVSESSSPKSSVAVKPKKVGSDEKVVPFCNYCNGRTTIPVHHAWCPRNAQFKTSGADEIFEKIKSGVTVKCLACLREYEMGRPILKSEHVDKCPRKLKQPDKCCNPKTSFPPRSTAQNSHSNGDIFEDGSQSVCVSFDDDPVDSIFADPLQAQQPYQTLLVARKDTTLSKKTAFISDEPSTMPNSCFVRSHATKQRETLNNQSVVATGLQENPLSKETTRSHKSVIFNADSDTDLDEEHGTDIDEVLHVSWETCGNVWGASGYTENDIVLFDLHKTLHHETIFTCERYAWSPFTSYTEYRESHWMPETGFQAIVLRRDALSIRPWGFTCARHAGGACLVTSVDPLSPAEAATFLGASSASITALQVNDMIISADGKEVGGMTTIGLEIALEEAGQEIVLLVSRYKDTRDTHYGFLTLQADDVAENQSSASCHVEWTDICDFDDAQKENHVLMAEDAPHLFPSLAKTEVSNAALAIDSVFPNDDVPNKERIHEPSQDVPAAPEGCYLTESVGFYSQDAPVQDIERDGYDEDAEFDRYGCPNSPGKVRANVLANAKTFAVSMGDLSITQPVVNKNCNTTDEASSLGCDTDDGNAWCGCVCGQLHDPSNKTLTIFWIQCGVCFTWYDCSTKCLGFTERNAESLDWACWACDENRVVLTEHIHFSTSSGSNLAKHLSSSKTSTRLFSTSMSSLKEVAAVSNTSDHELVVSLESSINHSENCVNVSIDNCDEEVFVEGDYVKIDEHAWPGVNNPEGIAKVLKAYTDDDGDQVYDVKYIVGGRKNGVLPEYLSLHLF